MTTKEKYVKVRYRKKKKWISKRIPERKTDMEAMNRFDYLNSIRNLSASFYSKKEWSLNFMRSSVGKQIRGNCVLGYECS